MPAFEPAPYPDPLASAGRPFRSAIPHAALQTIQSGTLAYSYKGVALQKNPFDLALYSQLIWREKPATILEIGSFMGGSAIWFGDQMTAFGIPANVVSVDIAAISGVSQGGVQFLTGDANNLSLVLTPDILDRLPRPWFVVEDSNHQASTCRAVLEFFHPRLMAGEFIAVEDGIVTDLGIADEFEGGPSYAVASFLAEYPGAYQIDAGYCDYFGYNFTYNINGYLRRMANGARP